MASVFLALDVPFRLSDSVVDTDGVKDVGKMRAFIAAVREAGL